MFAEPARCGEPAFGLALGEARMQRGTRMNGIRILALILILAGALGLAYGGFSYTKKTDVAKLGPIELKVEERETVNVPIWAGVGLIAVGAGLLFFGGGRR